MRAPVDGMRSSVQDLFKVYQLIVIPAPEPESRGRGRGLPPARERRVVFRVCHVHMEPARHLRRSAAPRHSGPRAGIQGTGTWTPACAGAANSIPCLPCSHETGSTSSSLISSSSFRPPSRNPGPGTWTPACAGATSSILCLPCSHGTGSASSSFSMLLRESTSWSSSKPLLPLREKAGMRGVTSPIAVNLSSQAHYELQAVVDRDHSPIG